MTYLCQSSHWGDEIFEIKADSPSEAAQELADDLENEVGDDSYNDVITVDCRNGVVVKYTARVDRTVLVEEISSSSTISGKEIVHFSIDDWEGEYYGDYD